MNTLSTFGLTLENDGNLYASRYRLADASLIADKLYLKHHQKDGLNIAERQLTLLDVLYGWAEEDIETIRSKK